jgi:hypothetical protein
MKALLSVLVLSVAVHAAETPAEPRVVLAPFEPPAENFFKKEDKFARPREIVAPQFLFPFEFRRHGGAVAPTEVIVLVQLDGTGKAKTLKVQSSRYEPFARSAIEALKKAKWDSPDDVWFYYRHVFTIE